MEWHYSKWKEMVPEESRSDFERFVSGHGFEVKRWVNYVPDLGKDPDCGAIQELAETWRRGGYPPVSSDSESPQFVPQEKAKPKKKPRKKRGE